MDLATRGVASMSGYERFLYIFLQYEISNNKKKKNYKTIVFSFFSALIEYMIQFNLRGSKVNASSSFS